MLDQYLTQADEFPTKPLDLPENPAGQRPTRGVRPAVRITRKRRMINPGD